VDRAAYDAFTDALVASLRDRVLGLVAVGSMAGDPDEWSDHDFLVVTAPGLQEEHRRDLSWLPDAARVLTSIRETAHGVQVIYDDGHLLEFAVFEPDELALASVNRYRVLFDHADVAERLTAIAARPSAGDDRREFGMFLSGILVGGGRARRGEELSGAWLVKGQSVRALAALLGGGGDDLDPLRRLRHPELEALMRAGTVDAALGLLDLAEREVRPRHPELAWDALDPVRRRLLI
jgi:hypothetical protein